ncbi:MAG: hypothetical protein AB1469_03105 [Pseudomonadota bacterium]
MKRYRLLYVIVSFAITLHGCKSLPEALIIPVDNTWQVAHIEGYTPSSISSSPAAPFIATMLLPPITAPALMTDIPDAGTPGLIEYTPKGQTLDSWNEMLTIQYLGPTRHTPRLFMDQLKTHMQSRCSNTTWEVISEDAYSILYEWRINQCPPHNDQHEIARIIQGLDGMHRVAYVTKIKELSEDQRSKWIKTFSEAYIEKDDKRVSTSAR